MRNKDRSEKTPRVSEMFIKGNQSIREGEGPDSFCWMVAVNRQLCVKHRYNFGYIEGTATGEHEIENFMLGLKDLEDLIATRNDPHLIRVSSI